MKFKIIYFFTFFLIINIESCNSDDDFDIITTDPCLTIDKKDKSFEPIKVSLGDTKIITFDILNECNYPISVLDVEIRNNFTEFAVQGIKKNDIINTNGSSFNVVYNPKQLGKTLLDFSIFTEDGQQFISIGVEAIP